MEVQECANVVPAANGKVILKTRFRVYVPVSLLRIFGLGSTETPKVCK